MKTESQTEIKRLIKSVKNHAELQSFCGISQFSTSNQTNLKDNPDIVSDGKESETPASLTDYYARIKDCQKCSLGTTRTNFVFGVGDSQADLVFVGEAPGKDEDLDRKSVV